VRLFRRQAKDLPPVIILGGGSNALSVARSLGRQGVRVYAINEPTEHVCSSRYAKRIPLEDDQERTRLNYLLGSDSESLLGAVLLSCDDAGIELLARHREQLAHRYLLDDSDPGPQLAMLDKYQTYKLAVEAGVPTPRFWVAGTSEEVSSLREEFVYPLLVKPFISHVFQQRFGKKFLVVGNFDELVSAYKVVADARITCMLVEMLQGPDELCCSYYTYMDEYGNALFDFTKRVYRRLPSNMGKGTFHRTEWNPEVRDVSLKLLEHVGLRGLACIEFRRDLRDGQLKLIECNSRFTAANALVAASGFDLACFVYNRLIGRLQAPLVKYRLGKRLWDPVEDFKAYRALSREGRITFAAWLSTVLHRHTMIYFAWDDPIPTLVHQFREIRGLMVRRLLRLIGKTRPAASPMGAEDSAVEHAGAG
jgi:D-aspartate ligase